jgi:quercetin dioxygenase-like cupin family protein
MKVIRPGEMAGQPVAEEGASGVSIRWLISKPEGASNFAMRLFELAPGGYTPLHTHSWEHEVFLLEGCAQITTAGGPVEAKAGDAVFVAPEDLHQFRNTGDGVMRMICLIPLPKDT